MSDCMELWLPFAPSVNHAYKRGRGGKVFKSPEAVAFFEEVRYKYAWLEPLTGDVSVTIDFYRPNRRLDIDNPIKLTVDSLQGLAYVNDKQVVELHVRRFDDRKNHPNGAARVTIANVSENAKSSGFYKPQAYCVRKSGIFKVREYHVMQNVSRR